MGKSETQPVLPSSHICILHHEHKQGLTPTHLRPSDSKLSRKEKVSLLKQARVVTPLAKQNPAPPLVKDRLWPKKNFWPYHPCLRKAFARGELLVSAFVMLSESFHCMLDGAWSGGYRCLDFNYVGGGVLAFQGSRFGTGPLQCVEG